MANILLLSPDISEKHEVMSLQHVAAHASGQVEVVLPYFDLHGGSVHVVKVLLDRTEALALAGHIVNRIADRL